MRLASILTVLAACNAPAAKDTNESAPDFKAQQLSESDVERPITRAMLVEMFDNMRERYGWDLSKPMVWGYFFFDEQRPRLEQARRRLEAEGFEFVAYLEPETQGDPVVLHVRRVEVHSVESLLARNEELYRLAEELGIDSYDGMDVGPIELDPDMRTAPRGNP